MDVLSDTSKPYNLILTKIDKLKSKQVLIKSEAMCDYIISEGHAGLCSPIVHMVSSHTGYGIHELMCGLI
jgi:GTP-binding protein EngB required for normal cell division